MERELSYIKESTKRFQYVSPTPTPNKLVNMQLYAPNYWIDSFYYTFSNDIDTLSVFDELCNNEHSTESDGCRVYMAITGKDYLHAVKVGRLFYNCEIIDTSFSTQRLVIDPLKVARYEYYTGEKYKFMEWIKPWVDKQELGGEVYLFDGPYYPKIKGYLLGEGYEPKNDYLLIREKSLLSKKYYLI